jgi:hypothetical protein
VGLWPRVFLYTKHINSSYLIRKKLFMEANKPKLRIVFNDVLNIRISEEFEEKIKKALKEELQ